MVYKSSSLNSLPSAFPFGRKLIRSSCLWTCSFKGMWTSTLSALSSASQPQDGCHPLFSRFPTTTTQLQEIGPHTVPGACTFGIGAFSFWQPCSQSCSVVVSYFFNVYCLPKMTSPRLETGEGAADSDRADFKCQVSSTEGVSIAGGGYESTRLSPSSWCAWPSHVTPHALWSFVH